MKLKTVSALFGVLCGVANAQPLLPDTPVTRSVSGQFIIYEAGPSLSRAAPLDLATNLSYLSLQPTWLAVSCERIKQAVGRELGVTERAQGRVYLALHPARSAEETITIASRAFGNRWHYRLELPDTVERTRFIRAMVNVVLLEMANRNATVRSAEIPAWLSEGLTRELLALPADQLTPPSPRWSFNGLTITPSDVQSLPHRAITNAIAQLRAHPPLTLEQLSWPMEEQFRGIEGDTYSASAWLFVRELMRFKDGRACLRAMLAELPQCYNWQTAFLGAFHTRFERLLDVEKWWALQVASFTGRDFGDLWSVEASWTKLDEILRTPVQIRRSSGHLPERAEVSLQTLVVEWEPQRQTPVLRARLRDLDVARLKMSQQIVGLVDDYRRVLADYLDKSARIGGWLPLTQSAASRARSSLARATIAELDALEARRQALRPGTTPVSTAKTESPPAP